MVGKRLPPLQSQAFDWARDWVRVIATLHHAIDKVEKPWLEGIRHEHDSDRPHQSRSNHHLISFLLLSFVSQFLANQLSRCSYSLPTLLETNLHFRCFLWKLLCAIS